jgi:aspartate aminotransferase
MKTVIIAAISRNNAIGRGNAIPWRYPADLKHFRRTTAGHPVVMGRRTFESLPRRPLPGRLNLVLTRDPAYPVPAGVVRCRSLEEARTRCQQAGAERMFVLGGAQVYRQALAIADEMVLTYIPEVVEADTFFPDWNPAEWRVVDSREEDGLSFMFYRRQPPRKAAAMFEKLDMAPPDPILGLTAAFKKDPSPRKINLGVGVYKDSRGNTPVFASVKEAERRILSGEKSKNYLPIEGSPEYGLAVQRLLFGPEHEILASGRAVTVQTPGGTGGLRVAGDLIHRHFPAARIWISDPTWANHPKVFQASGMEVRTYPYFDAATNRLAFDQMLAALEQIPAGDVLLLHGCCHNPTGVDPTPQQWSRIADLVVRRGLLPLVDFAYQGLGDGLREDATGLLALCRPGVELLVVSSFSKNFGLYNERVGALTLATADPDAAARALSHLQIAIRINYSNPPAHGAAIVTEILGDPELRRQWEAEVAEMRDRINGMRRLFVETLKAKGVQRDFSFIGQQRGMFSFSGLNPQQVQRLREQDAIYLVGSGRINVAGMTADNMEALCTAIASVL